MKNLFSLMLVCIFMLTMTACNSSNNSIDIDEIEINIGTSVKFTEEEIQQAMEVVIEDFFKDAKDMEHIELHSLSYDEEYSNAQMAKYRPDAERHNNMIIISSDFYVDDEADGTLNPDSAYNWIPDSDYNWMFILSRDNKNGQWNLDDWG